MENEKNCVSHWAPLEDHLADEGAKSIEMLRVSPVSLLLTMLKQDHYRNKAVYPWEHRTQV